MLVFSRRREQALNFPSLGITITILGHTDHQVRIGVAAPPEIKVLRGELADRADSTRQVAPSVPIRVDQIDRVDQVDSVDQVNSARRSRRVPPAHGQAPAHRDTPERCVTLDHHVAAAQLDGENPLEPRVPMARVAQGKSAGPSRRRGATKQMTRLRSTINAKGSVSDRVPVTAEQVPVAVQGQSAGQGDAGLREAGSRDAESVRARPVALLVDDSENETMLLAGFLRLRDVDVVVARDGKEALGYLENNEQPDVMLLDMAMPGMDGPSTLRHVRETPSLSELMVYGVSGGVPEDYGVKIGEGGVGGWFQKPVNPETLLSSIGISCRRPTGQGQAVGGKQTEGSVRTVG